jgi:hypothetical protein
MYWLRLDKQRLLQPMPLANQQERLTGSVALSPSSTRQAPAYQLPLNGSPEVEWLQTLQFYVLLRNQAAAGNDKRLRQLQSQLRQQAGSYLAPYVAFHYLRLHPSARPQLDSLTTRFAREQPTSPYHHARTSCSTRLRPWLLGLWRQILPSTTCTGSPWR